MISNVKVADMEHLPSHFAQEVSQQVKARSIDRMQAWQDGLKDAQDAKVFHHVTRWLEFLGYPVLGRLRQRQQLGEQGIRADPF